MKDIYMSDRHYRQALENLKGVIEKGQQLDKEDSDEVGNKYTTCSWGLCAENKEVWPTPEMHLWPDQFRKSGRIAPKYRKTHQLCPLDTRECDGDNFNGCFYTCLAFKRKGTLTKESVLELIEKRIKEIS